MTSPPNKVNSLYRWLSNQRSYLTKIDFNFIFEKVPIVHKTYTKFGIFQIGTFYGMLLASKQRSYLHSASFK